MIINNKKYNMDIVHADCIEYIRTLPTASVDLVFADPPFNVGKSYSPSQTDALPRDQYIAWCNTWLAECVRVLKPTGSIFVMTVQSNVWFMQHALEVSGCVFRNIIAWHNSSMPVKNRFCISYQPILYYTKTSAAPFNFGAQRRKSTAVLPYGRTSSVGSIKDTWDDIKFVSAGCMAHPEAILVPGTKRKAHPCQMPEGIAERAILYTTREGDLVLDPFMGSGTVGVVAQRLCRRYVGIDKEEQYTQLASARISESAVQ